MDNDRMNPTNGQDPRQRKPAVRPKALLGFALYLLLPMALFIAAGDFTWAAGWVYVFSGIGAALVSRLLALKKFPDLLEERSRYRESEGVQAGDRRLVAFLTMIGPLLTYLVAGFNHRFGWLPAIPSWLQATGWVLLAGAYLLAIWAMLSNRFFSAVVRIQSERGHEVVSSGPYAIIRHPAYAGGILGTLAGPLVLNTFWALLPAILVAAFTVVRTSREDRFLQAQLPGYPEYCARVRFRLLPGVY